MLKEILLQRKLDKLRKRMFTIPGLVWKSKYQVDEEATAKVCSEYTRICEEYKRVATELNRMKHRGEINGNKGH